LAHAAGLDAALTYYEDHFEFAARAASAAAPVCNGKYKGGVKPSDAELKEILKKHADWVKDGGGWYKAKLADDPRRANLCGADLHGLQDLKDAHLYWAYLEGAHLDGADLSDAHLDWAYLEGAHLDYANLEGADLNGAHLRART
jgi:Pentapeptide repeats (8 copies)